MTSDKARWPGMVGRGRKWLLPAGRFDSDAHLVVGISTDRTELEATLPLARIFNTGRGYMRTSELRVPYGGKAGSGHNSTFIVGLTHLYLKIFVE